MDYPKIREDREGAQNLTDVELAEALTREAEALEKRGTGHLVLEALQRLMAERIEAQPTDMRICRELGFAANRLATIETVVNRQADRLEAVERAWARGHSRIEDLAADVNALSQRISKLEAPDAQP